MTLNSMQDVYDLDEEEDNQEGNTSRADSQNTVTSRNGPNGPKPRPPTDTQFTSPSPILTQLIPRTLLMPGGTPESSATSTPKRVRTALQDDLRQHMFGFLDEEDDDTNPLDAGTGAKSASEALESEDAKQLRILENPMGHLSDHKLLAAQGAGAKLLLPTGDTLHYIHVYRAAHDPAYAHRKYIAMMLDILRINTEVWNGLIQGYPGGTVNPDRYQYWFNDARTAKAIPVCAAVEEGLKLQYLKASTGCRCPCKISCTQQGPFQGAFYFACNARGKDGCQSSTKRPKHFDWFRGDKYLLYIMIELLHENQQARHPETSDQEHAAWCWEQWLRTVKRNAHFFHAWILVMLNQDIYNQKEQAKAERLALPTGGSRTQTPATDPRARPSLTVLPKPIVAKGGDPKFNHKNRGKSVKGDEQPPADKWWDRKANNARKHSRDDETGLDAPVRSNHATMEDKGTPTPTSTKFKY